MCLASKKILISTSTAFCNCCGTLLLFCWVSFAPSLMWLKHFPCLLKVLETFVLFFLVPETILPYIQCYLHYVHTLPNFASATLKFNYVNQSQPTSDFFPSRAMMIRAFLSVFVPNQTSTLMNSNRLSGLPI